MDSDAVQAMPVPAQSWTETPPANPPLRHLIGAVVEHQTWVDQLATPFQDWLQKLFGPPGQTGRKLKDILHGTWLGHPIHPLLTDIPIGAWSGTLLLDFVWLGNENEGVAEAADDTLLFGLLGGVGSAVTGTTDWSDLIDTDRRVGVIHGLLNGGILVVNTASYALRRLGLRKTGIALSTTAYVVLAFSAYLGGELVFSKGVGVNHDAFEGGSDDFVPVMNEADLIEGKLTRVNAGGIAAVLLKQGKTIYAIGAICSHMGGPLDEGTVQDCVVTCPWHGSQFRMTDGSVVAGPAVYAQPTFAVRTRGGKIELRRLDHA